MIGATLFSGIGAPEVAMPHWHWPWHAEIEKFPSAVMKRRHPQSVNLGDVSAHGFAKRALASGRPDVIVFGSPCQSFSIAGGRLGLDDPRGNLALAALAVINEVRPRWFVFENVPDLVSSYSGSAEAESALRAYVERGCVDGYRAAIECDEDSDFAALLSAAHDIGYSLAWTVLDAQYFRLAQRRERLFAVGYLGDGFGPAAVLFEPQSLCGDHPPRREAGQRVAPTISARPTGGGGLGTDFDLDGGLIGGAFNNQGHGWWADADGAASPVRVGADGSGGARESTLISGAVSSKWAKGTGGPAGDECYNLVAPVAFKPSHFTRGKDGAPSDIVPALSADADKGDQDPVVLAFSGKDNGEDVQVNIAPTLRAMGHSGSHSNGGGQLAVAFQTRGSNVGVGDISGTFGTNADRASGSAPMALVQQVANTLTANSHKGNGATAGNRVGMVNPVILPHAVRRLTPRECERLQGFEDDYTLIKYRGALATDSPRYKALGNSMPVPVIRYILSRIEQVDLILRAP